MKNLLTFIASLVTICCFSLSEKEIYPLNETLVELETVSMSNGAMFGNI